MVHFRKSAEKKISLELDEESFARLGLSMEKEYSFSISPKAGIFFFSEEGPRKCVEDSCAKVIELVKTKPLTELVEGRFEAFLSKDEAEALNLLVKDGVIERFKLNESYKKAVYRLSAKGLDLKPFEDYSLESDGFLVIKNENRAHRVIEELKDKLNSKEVMGIKSFEGFYYFIKSDLFEKLRGRVLNFFRGKELVQLDQASESLNLAKILIVIVCEFLKEEGSLIEKRRGVYRVID